MLTLFKTTLLSLFFLASTFSAFSQTPVPWTKEERNGLYEDCKDYLIKYKTISQDQRESIALCYMDDVTKKYTRDDFKTKIDIEVKRIKDAIIVQCSKNLGITLDADAKKETPAETKPAKKNTPTKELLVGRWKTDNGSVIEFKEDGKYTEVTAKGKELSGDWFLDEKVLTISIYKKASPKPKSSKYDFDSFKTDYFKMTREGIAEVIQANRIK